VETVSPAAIQRFTDHFYRHAPTMLTTLVHGGLEGRMLLEGDQQRILDSALESAIGQLVSQMGPHAYMDDKDTENASMKAEELSASTTRRANTFAATLQNVSEDHQSNTFHELSDVQELSYAGAPLATDDSFGIADWPVRSDPIENGFLVEWNGHFPHSS
jgi:hypothetical protein